MRKLRMMAVSVFLTGMVCVASANMVHNGSFEETDPITITGNDNADPEKFNSFAITGWRAFCTPDQRDDVTLELVDDPAEATDGDQYIRMVSTVSGAGDFGLDIYDVAYRPVLTQGETYTFSFDARHAAGPENAVQVIVREWGETTVDHVNEWFELPGEWTSYTYTFTPDYDQSNVQIAFRPKAGGGANLREQTIHLDNVVLIPEPATLGMFLVATFGLLVARRRLG